MPRIAITRGNQLPNQPHLYEKAIQRAGGCATFVGPQNHLQSLAKRFDGLLIPGGRDILTYHYGEERLFDISPEDDVRTLFELRLLKEMLAAHKAVLGICYGMQVINVFFGGALLQDIRGIRPEALDHRRDGHDIVLRDAPFAPDGRYAVNSSHHQSIEAPGKGLTVIAEAPDGIAEAIHYAGWPFLVGVQWHPERLDDELGRMLFCAFVGACHAG